MTLNKLKTVLKQKSKVTVSKKVEDDVSPHIPHFSETSAYQISTFIRRAKHWTNSWKNEYTGVVFHAVFP